MQCLRHLLDTGAGDERILRQHVEGALDDDEQARAMLVSHGIRVVNDGRHEGLLIGNTQPVARIFAATEWADSRWIRVLRRLPGTAAYGQMRFAGQQRRATYVPAGYLDDGFVPRSIAPVTV